MKNAFAWARSISLPTMLIEPPMPWGKALLRSLRDKWYIFTEARQELAEYFGSRSRALGLLPPVELGLLQSPATYLCTERDRAADARD